MEALSKEVVATYSHFELLFSPIFKMEGEKDTQSNSNHML